MSEIRRKSHIKRCLGYVKDADGTLVVIPNIWIDVLRIDAITLDMRGDDHLPKPFKTPKEQQDPTTQDRVVTFYLAWDDADSDSEIKDSRNTQRQHFMLKATNPEGFVPDEFTPDPAIFVPVKTLAGLTFQEGEQELKYVFLNKNVDSGGNKISTSRRHSVIRLYHYATTVDDRLVGGQTKLRSAEDYQIVGDPDKAQYVDFELVKAFPVTVQGDTQKHLLTFSHEKVYQSLGFDSFDNMRGGGANANGDDIVPGRMDPFQQIVNCSWGAATEIREASSVYQPATNIANTDKILISMFVRIPKETFAKYPSVTILTFGPKGELLGTDDSDPDNPRDVFKRGSSISVTSAGEVHASFSGVPDSQTLVTCDASPTELGSETLTTNDILFQPPFTTTPIAEPPFINVLRFGVVAGYVESPVKGTTDVRIEYPGINYPTQFDGPLGWILTEPQEGDTGSIQLHYGDCATTNIFNLTPLHGVKVVFHFFGTGNGSAADSEDVAYQLFVDSQSKARGFQPDLWNHIYVTVDTSIPTLIQPGSPETVASAPVITVAVNTVDYTNTTITVDGPPDENGAPTRVEIEVPPGSSPSGKTSVKPLNMSTDYVQTCVAGDGGADNTDDQPTKIDPFQIAITDYEFAFPIRLEDMVVSDTNSNPQVASVIEYAGVQIFTGVAPEANDPDNIAYFAKLPATPPKNPISVNGVQMVPTAIARKRFGQPVVVLDGPPLDFIANGSNSGNSEYAGSAGEFTSEGDVVRYNPPPPLGI